MTDRERAIEAAAQALFNAKWATLVYRGAPDDMKDELREASSAMLDAILALTPPAVHLADDCAAAAALAAYDAAREESDGR